MGFLLMVLVNLFFIGIALLILAILFLLILTGVISSSLIVGISQRSVGKGFLALLLQVNTIIGFVLGVLSSLVLAPVLDLQLPFFQILTYGGIGGAISGLVISFVLSYSRSYAVEERI